jgi:Protein of unknown function (DUF3627)
MNHISDPYIRKVLKSVIFRMLTLKEFIKEAEYPIDMFMVDNFHKNLDDYISLEKLIKSYTKYQLYYQRYEGAMLIIKQDELINELKEMRIEQKEMRMEQHVQTEMLENMTTKLDVATDERAPRTESITKYERFILMKLNKKASPWDYCVIGRQRSSANQALKDKREMYKQLEVVIDLDYQTNAINLFNLIKQEIGKKQNLINDINESRRDLE